MSLHKRIEMIDIRYVPDKRIEMIDIRYVPRYAHRDDRPTICP